MPQTRSATRKASPQEIDALEGDLSEKDVVRKREQASAFKNALQEYQFHPSTLSKPENAASKIKESSPATFTSARAAQAKITLQPAGTKRSAAPTITPSPNKKPRRESSKYAPPSKYAHLPPLTDILAPDLICVFVGTNPGIRTATAGHAYAHPSNLFWKLLHSSGCTSRRCKPEEDVNLPAEWSMGNTNIVERPTKDAGELSKAEMAAGTPVLEEKMRKYRPEAVCIVGKGIWEAVSRSRHGRNPTKEEFRWGWQDEKENMGRVGKSEEGEAWNGARVFVTSSTSGLSASLRPHEKEAIWKPFGEWVQERRAQRAAAETEDMAPKLGSP